MSDANSVKNKNKQGLFINSIITDRSYPEVSVTAVHYLGGEVQIEQGDEHGVAIDLTLGSGNGIISISKEQALKLAHFIIDNLQEEK